MRTGKVKGVRRRGRIFATMFAIFAVTAIAM